MSFGTKGCMYFIGLCNKECITQEKKMYTEEEVYKIASKAFMIKSNNDTVLEDFNKWFEKFKKK